MPFSKLGMCKGHRLPVESIRKGLVPFLSKLAYKEQGVGPRVGASTDKTRVSTPPGIFLGHVSVDTLLCMLKCEISFVYVARRNGYES